MEAIEQEMEIETSTQHLENVLVQIEVIESGTLLYSIHNKTEAHFIFVTKCGIIINANLAHKWKAFMSIVLTPWGFSLFHSFYSNTRQELSCL